MHPRILVDKSPSYALDPAVLRKAEVDFEGARYIHLVRHPLPMSIRSSDTTWTRCSTLTSTHSALGSSPS